MSAYRREMAIRKCLYNQLIEEKGNIRVLCRICPLIPEDGTACGVVVIPDDDDDTKISIMHKDGRYQQYNFDKVFGVCAKQSQVRVCVSIHPRGQAGFPICCKNEYLSTELSLIGLASY